MMYLTMLHQSSKLIDIEYKNTKLIWYSVKYGRRDITDFLWKMIISPAHPVFVTVFVWTHINP